MSQIPEANRGTMIVARPSGIVKDVNAANGRGKYLGKTSAQADAAFAEKQERFIVVEWSK
jgi:hypothetical protein